jgi:uncharacterized RDD family membrane protein YckC
VNRPAADPAPRGARLGLPADGPGSLAPFDRRMLAFVLDLIAAGLVAAPFVHRSDLSGPVSHAPGQWSVIPWAVDYLFGLLLFGRTLGMYLTGLRVIRVDARLAVGPIRALVRTVLLALIVPALLVDSDLRGLHDRLTSTAVIRH